MDSLFEKNLITTKQASAFSRYSPDYLARLARSGKISGKRVGHSWLVERESLERFINDQDGRKIDRARSLARAREEEYRAHRSTIRRVTRVLTDELSMARGSALTKSSLRSHTLALSVALLVVAAGAFGARAAALPRFTRPAVALANEAAVGFGAMLEDGAARIAARIEQAGAERDARSRSVAGAIASASAHTASPLLAHANISLPRIPFLIDELPQSRIALTSVPSLAASANTITLSARDMLAPTPTRLVWGLAVARGVYALVTSPSSAAAALSRTHLALGEGAYAAILASFPAYRSLVERAGETAFSRAVASRDALAAAPLIVDRVNFAFGETVITFAHSAIRADAALAYWVADSAPASARAATGLALRAGGALSGAASRAPALAAALYLRAAAAPAELAPRLARSAFGAEYVAAKRFLAFSRRATEEYLALVEGAGRLAYAGASRATTLVTDTPSHVARAPRILENASLGALGRAALALESLTFPKYGNLSAYRNPVLAAAANELSTGERAALALRSLGGVGIATYETISGFMRATRNTFAALFAPPPPIVMPSVPQKSRVAVATSTPRASTPAPRVLNSYPTYTTVVQGVSQDSLARSLAALRADVLATAAGMVRPVAAQSATNATTIQYVNMIQDLSNLIVRNGDFRGGVFDNGERVSATTGTFTNLNGGSTALSSLVVNGAASLATTTITGALTVSGTTTPSVIAATNYISAPYFVATSTFATSTFAGALAIDTDGFVYATTTRNVGVGVLAPAALLAIRNSTSTQPIFVASSAAGAEVYRITNAGNVGIGTTTPGHALAVEGSSSLGNRAIAGYFTATTSTATSTFAGALAIGTSTPFGNGLFIVGTTTPLFHIASNSGFVGIGTSSPSDTLALNGAMYFAPVSAPSVATHRLYNVGNDLYWAGNVIGGATTGHWTTDGTHVWRPGGNVGIGTTSPWAKLSVVGASDLGNFGYAGYFVATTSTASTFPYASTTMLTATTASTTNLIASGAVTFQNLLGMLSSNGTSGVSARTLTGTANQITITNGDGTGGNPTFSLPAALSFTNATSTSLFAERLTANTFAAGQTGSTTVSATGALAAPSLSLTTALPVSSGGTGWSAIQASAIPYGAGAGALATTTAGTAGYVLSYQNGIPTWVATTTFSSGLAYAGGNVTNTGVLSLAQTYGSAQTGALTFATTSQTANGQTHGLAVTNTGGAFTFSPTISGTLDNAGLTNSTISGVALGGTLASLSATDATLTFSGAYTGATARTVGLNLGNANTWTALQTFASASSTNFSNFGTAYFGATATSTFASTGSLTLPASALLTAPYASTTMVTATTASTTNLIASGAVTFQNLLGMLSSNGTSGVSARTLTGTANQITITNGDGTGGNPTFSLPAALSFTNATSTSLFAERLTANTFAAGQTGSTTVSSTGALAAPSLSLTTALPVSSGGTGQTTFTSSQLLYGNGTAALSSVATTSLSLGTGLSYSGTLGALVGGAAGSLTVATSSLYSGTTGQLPYFSGTNTLTATSSLFLAASGNVGIGTANPTYKLSVVGDISIPKDFIIDFDGGSSLASIYATELTPGNVGLVFGTLNDALAITSTGNVGIGTTSPYALLSIGGDAVIGASTAGGTLGDLYLPKLGTAAGTFLAADPTGKVIATSTPGGSGTVTSIATTYPITGGTITTTGTLALAFGTTTSNTWDGTQTFTNAPIFSSLTGILKGNGSSALTVAANGTDYTLLTSTTCSGTDKISAVTASGGVTCSADTGGATVGTVSTSTTPVIGNLAYWTGTGYPSTLGTVATTSLTLSGFPASIPNTLGKLVGGSDTTWTWWGLATTSQPASSNLLTSNGAAGVYGTATSTLSATSPLTGSFTQVGSGGSLGCQTASGSQAGCLSSANWTTFNGKESVLTFNTPLMRSANTISWVGLATTSQPASSNLLVSNGAAGVYGVATSSETCSSPLSCAAHTVLSGGGAISIANAAADGSTKGAASFTAADFDATTGNISIDYTNGQAASASAKGFVTSANWSTFNNKWDLASTTIGVAYGGTGATTLTGLLQGNGTSAITGITGTAGQFPYYNGASTLLATSTLFLATNSNVGIGTAGPSVKLEVSGAGLFSSGSTAQSLKLTSTDASTYTGTSAGNPRIAIDGPATINTYSTIGFQKGGIAYAEFGVVNVDNTNSRGDFVWKGYTGGAWIERMRIDYNGNVGIGTTNPASAKLHIDAGSTITTEAIALQHAGAADGNHNVITYLDQSSASTWQIQAWNVSDAAATADFVLKTRTMGSTPALIVKDSGNVGIGTTSPATLLEVGGTSANVTFDGYKNCTGFTSNGNGLLACTASDRSLKQNIVPLDGASILSSIEMLNPVSFYWNPATERGSGQQFGLIAQEVQNVFPNLVVVSSPTELTPDGTLSINYEGLISPVILAIQELGAKFRQIEPIAGVLSVAPGVESQCVTADTRLRRRRRRADGSFEFDEVDIRDIAAGDEVASLDEQSGRIVYARVNALIDMGEQEVYELVTKSGMRIRTTANHPFMARTVATKF